MFSIAFLPLMILLLALQLLPLRLHAADDAAAYDYASMPPILMMPPRRHAAIDDTRLRCHRLRMLIAAADYAIIYLFRRRLFSLRHITLPLLPP